MGKILSLGALAIGGLIVADLWAHSQVTDTVIGAGVTESKLLAGQ
jgi:hypothetical protein